MNFRLRALVTAGLTALILSAVPVSVLAQTDEGAEENTVTTQQTATAEEEANVQAELNARLEKRKADRNTRLDFARQARLKNRCKAAQGGLSNISGRIKGLETSRSKVYENLVVRLDKLSERLKTNNLDTAELDRQLAELNNLVETFDTNLAEYSQSAADLAIMDCVADPVAFQASLETAREARALSSENAKAIKAYLANTIKPTLQQLKQQFAQNNNPQTQEANEPNTGENE